MPYGDRSRIKRGIEGCDVKVILIAKRGGGCMRRSLWTILLVLMLPLVAYGNDDILMLQQDDGQWVTQGKDYGLTRYSPLKQITAQNVHRLNAAWTFSLGVLRGQEGSPLVVGTTMYVHTGFPNIVYALDLTQEGAPLKW